MENQSNNTHTMMHEKHGDIEQLLYVLVKTCGIIFIQ